MRSLALLFLSAFALAVLVAAWAAGPAEFGELMVATAIDDPPPVEDAELVTAQSLCEELKTFPRRAMERYAGDLLIDRDPLHQERLLRDQLKWENCWSKSVRESIIMCAFLSARDRAARELEGEPKNRKAIQWFVDGARFIILDILKGLEECSALVA